MKKKILKLALAKKFNVTIATILICLVFLTGIIISIAAQSGQWIEKADTPEAGGYGETLVGVYNYIYIARCMDASSIPAFWRHDPLTNKWDFMNNSTLPTGAFRNGAALAWDHNNYIYALLGGRYSDSNRTFFYRYSISNNTWERLMDTPHAQGAGDAITYSGYDNQIYAILGSKEHGTTFACYNLSIDSWSTLPFNPNWTTTDDGASLIWTGEEYLYALRGEWQETEPCEDFARYHISTRIWEDMSPIPKTDGVGDGGSLLWIDDYPNYIFALGGGNCTEAPGYNFYRYHISNNNWEELESIPCPIGNYVGNRLGFSSEHIYYWQGTPSTWECGGNAFYMFELSPTIISWSNNITNDNQTNITIERLTYVKFNATANQNITTWNWFKDGVNQNYNYDNITLNWNTTGLKTVKVNTSNINGVSNTITWNITVQDTTPPRSISNIQNSTGNFWINWSWTNPINDDFNHTSVYINNIWKANTTRNYYNYTDLSPHNISTISARTVDIYGNINTTWMNQTTQIPNNNITIIDIPSTKAINENETLFIDTNAIDLDNDIPTFSCNRTDLFKDFNIATGKGNFTPFYNQSGVYAVDFSATDGYESISNKTITITVIDIPLVIASYWNNKTGSNLVTACWQNETIEFGVTTNRTANVTCYYDGILEQNSSSLNYTKQFTTRGTHHINVSAHDQYDHTANTTFTVKVPEITVNETQINDFIQANNSTTFIYNNISIVNSLSVITNNTITNVSIEVQELADVSSSLFMIGVSGTPYAYFNIIATNLTNANLTSLTITFTVNKSWLQNSGLDPNNVKLNRYHNNSWEAHSAIKINETSTNITYIATNMQGLSIFAITAFSMPTPTPPQARAEEEVVGVEELLQASLMKTSQIQKYDTFWQ